MSKNKNNPFKNRAARRFKDMNKVDLMSQEEIYEIFNEDMRTILDQITANREGKPNSPYPVYIGNAFANISSALYFYKYVKKHIKITKKGKVKASLEESDIESLRTIIADAYRKSATNVYANQALEYSSRNEYLSKTFILLSPDVYRMTKKLEGLSKSERRDLTIQVYGDPVYNFKYVQYAFNRSTLPEKKKLKLLRKLYGKNRFIAACGAAMTVEGNSSDCLAMIFDYICTLKKKAKGKKAKKLMKKGKLRGDYLLAYANAYKRNKTRYFRIDKSFFDDNKKIIKVLIKMDEGYKKAFRDIKATKGMKRQGSRPVKKQ